ncbi:MAG: shikimate kinase [Lentisphaerae bacterium]|nr:shikimate kinase [Lentisphaerota bacterium]
MNKYSNIVLAGFMGTGKTEVGKRLAKKLSMTFVDMDDLIVERQDKPIPKIFAEKGESFFRNLEKKLAKELSAQSGMVIATGGGIVLDPINIAAFQRSGLVVCLSATPQTILSRIKTDTNRPLLAESNKMNKIKSILKARQHLYDAIEHQIDTTNLTIDGVVRRILDICRTET